MSRIGRHTEVFPGADGWYWRLVGGNGEVMTPSQAYTRKWNAKRAALSVHPDLPLVMVDGDP